MSYFSFIQLFINSLLRTNVSIKRYGWRDNFKTSNFCFDTRRAKEQFPYRAKSPTPLTLYLYQKVSMMCYTCLKPPLVPISTLINFETKNDWFPLKIVHHSAGTVNVTSLSFSVISCEMHRGRHRIFGSPPHQGQCNLTFIAEELLPPAINFGALGIQPWTNYLHRANLLRTCQVCWPTQLPTNIHRQKPLFSRSPLSSVLGFQIWEKKFFWSNSLDGGLSNLDGAWAGQALIYPKLFSCHISLTFLCRAVVFSNPSRFYDIASAYRLQ